jgi:hypothetical protein
MGFSRVSLKSSNMHTTNLFMFKKKEKETSTTNFSINDQHERYTNKEVFKKGMTNEKPNHGGTKSWFSTQREI